MKILSILFFSAFMFFGSNTTDVVDSAECTIAPQTTVCVVSGRSISCTNFLDGAECFIGINGDEVYAAGPDC